MSKLLSAKGCAFCKDLIWTRLATAQAVGLLRDALPFRSPRGPLQTKQMKPAPLCGSFYANRWPHEQDSQATYLHKKTSAFAEVAGFICPLRRERDSNPRNSCPFTAFRVRPDRPLRHLSFVDLPLLAFRDCKCRDNF